MKQSKSESFDEREQSITITVPPLGISVFRCTPLSVKDEKVKRTTKKQAAAPEKRKTKAKKVSLKALEENRAKKKEEVEEKVVVNEMEKALAKKAVFEQTLSEQTQGIRIEKKKAEKATKKIEDIAEDLKRQTNIIEIKTETSKEEVEKKKSKRGKSKK